MTKIDLTDIRHENNHHRFVLSAGDDAAVLEYHLFEKENGARAVDFTRTWVPPAARGKGLAERLVREGLRWAKSEDLEVQASCWYVAKFLRAS